MTNSAPDMNIIQGKDDFDLEVKRDAMAWASFLYDMYQEKKREERVDEDSST